MRTIDLKRIIKHHAPQWVGARKCTAATMQAIENFSQLRVWDTEYNSGVLIGRTAQRAGGIVMGGDVFKNLTIMGALLFIMGMGSGPLSLSGSQDKKQ